MKSDTVTLPLWWYSIENFSNLLIKDRNDTGNFQWDIILRSWKGKGVRNVWLFLRPLKFNTYFSKGGRVEQETFL